jgi:hypothetical protein
MAVGRSDQCREPVLNLGAARRPELEIMRDTGLTVEALRKCLWIAACVAGVAAPARVSAQDNPLARGASRGTVAMIDGRWNGSNLERRANCSALQNNGSRGTYAEFDISTNAEGDLGITQTGITGLTCNYFGKYVIEGANRSATGTYSCSDGKRGDFRTKGILVTENAVSIRMDIQLNTTETCAIDAVIGGSRFFPN